MNARKSPRRSNKSNKTNKSNTSLNISNDAADKPSPSKTNFLQQLDTKLEMQTNVIVAQLTTEILRSEGRIMKRLDAGVEELHAVKATINGIEKRVTAVENHSITFHNKRYE